VIGEAGLPCTVGSRVRADGAVCQCALHVHIEIGVFSYAAFVVYLGWILPETLEHLPDKMKHAKRRPDRNSNADLPSEP
jgi:hypothetical protein